jgi:hypothetical protein
MIPQQLIGLRFCKVGNKFKVANDKEFLKRPHEIDWQNQSYTYEEADKWMTSEDADCFNYGIICGSDVRALDDDTPKKGLITLYYQNFPKTFRVRNHIYFKFDNGYSDKIIFEHKSLLFPNSKGKLSSHMGELQGEGSMVVGAGSKHPSGEKYEVVENLPIATISYNKFLEVYGEYLKENTPTLIRNHKSSNWKGDNVTQIPLGDIISFDGLRDVGRGCLQGTHPKHGSENGMNFRVDTLNNCWHCFRCGSGGGASELIAVMEGLKDCSKIGKNCFSVVEGHKIIQIAREKYGLSIPEKQETLSPKGWGRVLNIQSIAEKEGIINCPKCGKQLSFNISKGYFSCNHCEVYGGLKKLLVMAIKSKQEPSP